MALLCVISIDENFKLCIRSRTFQKLSSPVMMMLYPGAKSPDREGRDQGGHDQGEVGVVPGLATREGESQEPGGDGQAAEGAG